MRIKVVGDEITSWLNGIQMVHLKDVKFGTGKGFIALQIHAGGGIKVRWKDSSLMSFNISRTSPLTIVFLSFGSTSECLTFDFILKEQ